jgi:hypothetical protein
MSDGKKNMLESKRTACALLKKKFGVDRRMKIDYGTIEAWLGDFRHFVDFSCGNRTFCESQSYSSECPGSLSYEERRKEYFPDRGIWGSKSLPSNYFD